MKVFENLLFFMVVCVVLCYCNVKNDTQKAEQFVPTNEWQTVKKGQPLPRGLHVRVNFETGVTEAKLVDPNDNEQKSLSTLPESIDASSNDTTQNSSSSTNTFKHDAFTPSDDLVEALKHIPGNVMAATDPKKYRTLEELKSEFQELKMEIKSDMEIMQDLFKRYAILEKYFPITHQEQLDQETVDSPASVEVLNILVDLEYLVHQIDNANEFVKLKGLEKIVYPHLNGTDNTLKAEAIKLLGACLQNNIRAQIYALETNAGDYLLKILALDKNEHVKSRAVFALGCLVRRFPLAQKQIISKHGMDVFHKLLLSDNPTYVKLKIKIIMLLEDLVLEHKSVLENHISGNPLDEEKLRQYYQVDLMSKLSNPASCDILSRLLQEYFEYDSTNVDNIDKIFSVINTFSHICKHHHYKDKKLLIVFHKMQTLYKKIVLNKTPDSEEVLADAEFFSHILEHIDNYINELNDAKLRDEL